MPAHLGLVERLQVGLAARRQLRLSVRRAQALSHGGGAAPAGVLLQPDDPCASLGRADRRVGASGPGTHDHDVALLGGGHGVGVHGGKACSFPRRGDGGLGGGTAAGR